MSHTRKLFLIVLSTVLLVGCTASQVLNSAVSAYGTLGSIGQSSTPTGPFKFDNSQPDLSLTARFERGKALPKYEGQLASPEWLQRNCTATYRPGSSGPVSREQCIEQLAAAMPAFDPNKPRHFGERYSPKTWRDCRLNAHDFGGMQGRYSPGDCDRYKLRRIENPTFWPYEHNKDFRWPEAPKEVVYRPGMTPEAYHKALCEKESGQWAYKKIERVGSYYQIRPHHPEEFRDDRRDRFVSENPVEFVLTWGMFSRKRPSGLGTTRIGGEIVRAYAFVETPARPIFGEKSGSFVRHETRFIPATVGHSAETVSRPIAAIESRYGFVWRGIERDLDRETDVAGVEWAVVDLQTNEVVSLMRTFLRGGGAGAGFYRGMQACPFQASSTNPYLFLTETLKPKLQNE